MHYLDFEKPVIELEKKIEELRHTSSTTEVNIVDEVSRLQEKVNKLLEQIYSKLSPWEIVEVARHPDRPHTKNFISALMEDFIELAGDRNFADDPAIIGGLATFEGQPVLVMGHEKGHDTETRLSHNFGMPKPEGYRKAQRLMELANRFNLPIITFIDTAGAYPGVGAEERGQSEAIARSIEKCLELEVPLIAIVIGEGGSGGAIAIATGNSVMMLQNSVYSVISPEGCASILWRSADKKKEAAEALKLTAKDLLGLKVIDSIIEEPLGGAHRDASAVMSSVKNKIQEELTRLMKIKPEQLKKQRRDKFLKMGRAL